MQPSSTNSGWAQPGDRASRRAAITSSPSPALHRQYLLRNRWNPPYFSAAAGHGFQLCTLRSSATCRRAREAERLEQRRIGSRRIHRATNEPNRRAHCIHQSGPASKAKISSWRFLAAHSIKNWSLDWCGGTSPGLPTFDSSLQKKHLCKIARGLLQGSQSPKNCSLSFRTRSR